MAIGLSIFLLALGAVLFWGVTATVAGISIDVIGVILMVVGVIGLFVAVIAGSRADATDRRVPY